MGTCISIANKPIYLAGNSLLVLKFSSWGKKLTVFSDALLLKQMPQEQTVFVLLLKQNKTDLVFHHQN